MRVTGFCIRGPVFAFGVQGFGDGVSRFKVSGSGFRVSVAVFEVRGFAVLGFVVSGSRVRGFSVRRFVFGVRGFAFRGLGFRFRGMGFFTVWCVGFLVSR